MARCVSGAAIVTLATSPCRSRVCDAGGRRSIHR